MALLWRQPRADKKEFTSCDVILKLTYYIEEMEQKFIDEVNRINNTKSVNHRFMVSVVDPGGLDRNIGYFPTVEESKLAAETDSKKRRMAAMKTEVAKMLG